MPTLILQCRFPAGCTLLSATVYTSVAYTAATDCKIQIGNAAAGAQYVAAVSIAAIVVPPSLTSGGFHINPELGPFATTTTSHLWVLGTGTVVISR